MAALPLALPSLRPPARFAFPYDPYGIQLDFMQALYTAIEAGGLAIFESPTGTVRAWVSPWILDPLIYAHHAEWCDGGGGGPLG
jgi:hypothetical protein